MLILSVIIHFAAGCLLMALVNRLGAIPWRRAANAHWTERARLLFPVRLTSKMNVLFIPALLQAAHWAVFPDGFATTAGWILPLVSAFVGAFLGGYPLDTAIYPGTGFKTWLLQKLAIWGILFSLVIILIVAYNLMPLDFGWPMLPVAAGYIICSLALSSGLILKYLKLIKYLRPAGPRLLQIIEARRSKLGNVTVRAAWQFGGPIANAYALPVTRELAFSDRLLAVCDDDEVAAICDHELAHLKESKAVLAVRLAGSLVLLPFTFFNPCIQHFGFLGLFPPLLATLFIALGVKAFSQRMEKKADAVAHQEQTHDGVYARSLEKIYQVNLIPAVNINNRQTHPHLYDRMLAAGLTPDYPRPKKPKRMTWSGRFIVALCVVFVCIGAVRQDRTNPNQPSALKLPFLPSFNSQPESK